MSMPRPTPPPSPFALIADLATAAAHGASAAAVTRAVAVCLGRHLPLRAVELAWINAAGDAADVVHARLGEGEVPLAAERRPLSATAGRVALERGELVLARTTADGAAGGPAERAVAEHVDAGWFLVVPLVAERGPGGFAVLYLAADGQRRPVLDEDLVEAVRRVLAGAQQRVRQVARVAATCRRQSRRVGAAARYDRHAAPPPVLVAESPAMRRLVTRLADLAGDELPLLIQGPAGSGRATVARVAHAESGRRGAFVPVRGAAREVDALLFGREFPRRRGLVELADGGTLFVSEADQLPRPVQRALVDLVETGRCTRVGGGAVYGVDARLILSTRHDLPTLAAAGRFHPELAALLDGRLLRVPPLAERGADVTGMTTALFGRLADRLGIRAPRATAELQVRLAQARFPGEARGLANALERALLEAPPDTHLLGVEQVFPPPQIIDRPVPHEVRVEVPVPHEVRVEVPVPYEVRVEVPVEVPVPYEVRVEVPVEVPVPYEVRVEVPVPYEVRVEVPVPYEVRVEVPYEVRVEVPVEAAASAAPTPPLPSAPASGPVLTFEEAVRDALARALVASKGRIYGPGGAAALLGLQPSTLQSKMEKVGLTRGDFEPPAGHEA